MNYVNIDTRSDLFHGYGLHDMIKITNGKWINLNSLKLKDILNNSTKNCEKPHGT